MSSENDFSVFQHKIERIKLILCACSQKLVCNGNFVVVVIPQKA